MKKTCLYSCCSPATRNESFRIVSRTIQWRFSVLTEIPPSQSFKLGNHTWKFALTYCIKPQCYQNIRLCVSTINCLDGNRDLVADFMIRVVSDKLTWPSAYSKVQQQCFQGCGNPIYYDLGDIIGKCLLIEFELLKMETRHWTEVKLVPEWPAKGPLRDKEATHDPLSCLSRMFTEAIHTDLTINTKDGTLSAHKALLAASSPVFARMFESDFKEKTSSTVDIRDMSLKSCEKFLKYLYGNLREEELWSDRIALLEAAHKYGILKLQKLCEERLREDINMKNVLERLVLSRLYELKDLKQDCMSYLFDLQKVAALKDTFISFVLDADPTLAKELLEMAIPAFHSDATYITC